MSDYFIMSFISSEWGMFFAVPHYIAMSKYAKVLCVEPPLTIFDMMFRPRKIWKRRLKIKNRLRQINENLFIYTPIAVAPFGLSYRSNLLSRLNRLFIARGVEKLIQHLQIEKYIFVIHSPQQSCLVDILNPLARVFEIVDEYGTSEKCSNSNRIDSATKAVEREEKKILAGVDLIFVTAKKLYERKHQYNRNVYFIPNGVDLEHFWSNSDKKLPDITAIPRPRIGYVGHINTFLNFEWLDYSASRHPEWSFVFLGIFDNKKILKQDYNYLQFVKRKNVFMLGWKKYEDLPAYMREIEVFLLPRRNYDWCQNSNPNRSINI